MNIYDLVTFCCIHFRIICFVIVINTVIFIHLIDILDDILFAVWSNYDSKGVFCHSIKVLFSSSTEEVDDIKHHCLLETLGVWCYDMIMVEVFSNVFQIYWSYRRC